MRRVTNAGLEKRVGEIISMIINGADRGDIVRYSSKNWGIGERQIDKYIVKAKLRIQREITKNIEFDYAKAIIRYETLYKKAIEVEDYRLALSINKELSSIQGLQKLEIKHSGNIEFISNIPD